SWQRQAGALHSRRRRTAAGRSDRDRFGGSCPRIKIGDYSSRIKIDLVIASALGTPVMQSTRFISSLRIANTRSTPRGPNPLTPHATGRPTSTAFAPKARALTISPPLRMPLSSSTGTFAPTPAHTPPPPPTPRGKTLGGATIKRETPPAVIGHQHSVGTGVDRHSRVLGAHHAFNHDRQ